MKNNKTYIEKVGKVDKTWHLIDAQGQTLGRLATKIANILRGKEKVIFSPHMDTGDFVVVINAKKIKVTGKKMSDKIYANYSGYPGGLKETNLGDLLKKHPTRAIFLAVSGMLPKNKLRKVFLKKLRVYADDKHKQEAQKPLSLELNV